MRRLLGWMLWPLAALDWHLTNLGYWIRPYDMIADARRWRWQPRAKCGTRWFMENLTERSGSASSTRSNGGTMPDTLHSRVAARVAELRAIAEAGSEGPWELGDVWLRAGVMTSAHYVGGHVAVPAGSCAFCHLGEPVHVGQMDINDKRKLGHVHRNPDPWEPARSISARHGLVLAGSDDYGPCISEPDAALIVAAVNTLRRAIEAWEETLAEHCPGPFCEGDGHEIAVFNNDCPVLRWVARAVGVLEEE